MLPASDKATGIERAMALHVYPDPAAAAEAAAEFIAARAREALAARGRFVMAASGGTTPRAMYVALAAQDLLWPRVHVLQADERIVPTGDRDRSLQILLDTLVEEGELPPQGLHPMPVDAPYLEPALRFYGEVLQDFGGKPAVLDLVHLGLGADGHTASLIPGDAALDVVDSDVALSGVYHGHRRMTLTFPILNRARCLLWLVTGAGKAPMLQRLLDGDSNMPAGRLSREQAVVFADAAAAKT